MVQVSDGNVPPLLANATVNITFTEDLFPTFDNLPYAESVSENDRDDKNIYRIRARDEDREVNIHKVKLSRNISILQ